MQYPSVTFLKPMESFQNGVTTEQKKSTSLNIFIAFKIGGDQTMPQLKYKRLSSLRSSHLRFSIDRISADVTDARQIQSGVPPTLKVP